MAAKHRDQHRLEVVAFLRSNVASHAWNIELPPYGTGQETYIAQANQQKYFIKLGAELVRYQIMAELGFSPSIIATGILEDGMTILVQAYISGRVPSRHDFQANLLSFAQIIRTTHHNYRMKRILPPTESESFRDAGFAMIHQIEHRWARYRSKLPSAREYVNENIEYLKDEVSKFSGSGLVASHNDICNGNWLISDDGAIYLLDYEGMSLDDPALDVGAILWWYYPPAMRPAFLKITGYDQDTKFGHRMRIRMAIHNLHIIMPRENSFDQFSTDSFDEALTDFRAIIAGKENPQGYND